MGASRKARTTVVFSAAVLMVVIAGASVKGGAEPGDAVPETRRMIDFLRSTVSYEYVPYESPEAMLADVDAAAAGRVESVEAAIIADDGDGQGAVIVGMRVTESWKPSSYQVGDTLFYTFPRPQGAPIDQYRTAMPIGLEVAVFAHQMPVDYRSGDPAPADALIPAPQGLLIHNGALLENVWGAEEPSAWPALETVADLRAALED